MAEYFFGITDTGLIRTNNEDCFIAQKIAGTDLVLAAVIDGVGGYEGGELASALAQECILKEINKALPEPLTALKHALINANEKIFTARTDSIEHNKMACVVTLVIADPENNKFYYAHLGDTRLYLLRDKTLVKITRDHSTVGFLEESGRLTEEEAMHHPRRNEITKALGFQMQIDTQSDFIETSESPFLPGDTLLLCSDGLTDMINTESITGILNTDFSLAEKGEKLITAANAAGGNDNITLVIVTNNSKPLLHKATKPKEKKSENDVVPQQIKNDEIATSPVEKKSNSAIPLLIFIILGLSALSGWLWFQKSSRDLIQTKVEKPAPGKTRSELAFAALVNDTVVANHVINLSPAQLVILTTPVFFTKDSVLLQANNAIITTDSSFNGPAFIFSKSCKYIRIDSATFKNFITAIQLNGQEIVFNNVQFKNCVTSMQQNIILSDSTRSGHLPAIQLSRTDSIPTHP
ncbi:MAG: protein phosphatase 2C domain-containing protein [Ferruginibacter sp.]